MEIKNKYIMIPNILIADNEISIHAKYLYGWIRNELYEGQFENNIGDIMDLLNCSMPSARKYIKELQHKNYIKVEIINNNTRRITPLISDSMILHYYRKKKIERESIAEEIIKNIENEEEQITKEKQKLKEFYNEVK